MNRNLGTQRDAAVERLRWMLLAAVSGAAVACAGRSEGTPGGEAGQATGGTSASGGSAGTGTGGTTGGTGTGGTGTGGTGTGATGGSGGSVGGSGGVGVGGSSVGGAGGSTGGTAGVPEGCAAGTSISPTLEQCEGGFVHRPETGTCQLPERDGPAGAGGQPPIGSCASDDDCNVAPDGYCIAENAPPEGDIAYCVYTCSTDADCDAGQICSCEPNYTRMASGESVILGVCRTAGCVVDSDCGADSLCISPVDSNCGTPRPGQFQCQTAADECAGPADCLPFEYCDYLDGRHVCQDRPICGRPFVVDGSERLARLTSDCENDWLDDDLLGVPPAPLGTADRRAIARHFADAGLMEHASIAAFARFALQLLALGAPSDLVDEATRAMADETRHARLCFGLARRYGLAAAPGPLDMKGALGAVDLESVVDLVVVEGCVGEATAAIEAAWASEAATDPVVAHVLAGIAADEARHAALAFRFVGWACEREPRLRDRVARLVAEAAARPEAVVGAGTRASAVREAHGVLSPALRRAARRAALVGAIPTALDRLGINSAARELDVA